MITDADVRKALHAKFSMESLAKYLNERNHAISQAKETQRTLRDEFAAKALQGLLSSRSADWDIGDDKAYTSNQAYQYADAMLKERAK